ncbi:MAG TPA: CoA transferase, partial [Ilumatobacteraceae bacterium]|nr:CoA transferase [Ilumatobacteraceae bacterium]
MHHPRVIDFSTHLSGPTASRELVHLGFDVIKVERPRHGDGNRSMGAQVAGASAVHHALSSGTRSVVLDRTS